MTGVGRAESPGEGRAATTPRRYVSPRFDQFDSVAEGIIDVDSPVAVHWRIRLDWVTLRLENRDESIQSVNHESRMGLLCRTKVWIYSQMNLEFGALEPAATAFPQVGRLGYFGQAEDVAIKLASALLSACGYS